VNLASIPPHGRFLDAVAAAWLDGAADELAAADGLILLPTRRAARSLAEAFLVQTDGRPLLLPRITAFGALDETPLALAGALDLPPAVPAAQRLAQLARLVMALDGRFGAPDSADRAWPLAAELAALMDEAERAEIDLATVLPGLAAEDYAQHWQMTLEFMAIVTTAWPGWLAENGLMNPAARQIALLDAQSAAWAKNPPETPVWAVGSTGGIPAVARLLKVVATMPLGRVVLPGVDAALDDEAWDQLDDSHPQSGLRRLLMRLGARRGDVGSFPALDAAPAGRTALLNRALLPAAALGVWRDPSFASLDGITRLSPADQQEEAVAIALALRGALEVPNARAALVTPDRGLAGRVTAELARYGVVADDSAGEPLLQTPPAAFLRLLVDAVAGSLRPVPLLALLKHPFASAGQTPSVTRAAARGLEHRLLRGPAPKPGIEGLRRVAKVEADLAFVDRVEACLAPLLAVFAEKVAPLDGALTALLKAAEALARTADMPGRNRLWSGEDGQALAAAFDELLPALAILPPQRPDVLAGLLEAALAGQVIRSRRALRGREDGVEHPRIFIWGLLEARLQRAELIVLGGLAEGVWPPAADPGPWMSRPMRRKAGLPSPEEAVGQMAHDFVMTACAAPQVILSCPRRRDGVPTVPARWLVRLDAMLRGAGQALPEHPAMQWARALDHPVGGETRRMPPAPRPALAVRPRSLSVTEIETWLRDPYAIYARRILNLKALDPLEQSADAADYGSIVHAAIAAFLNDAGTRFPPDAEGLLIRAMDAALLERDLRPALAAWWRPRLRRIAAWVADTERERRLGQGLAHIVSEKLAEWPVGSPMPFTLRGRADRIERRFDGSIAILDYKTGAVPKTSDVAAGLAPQLPLEAAMAAAGAFGPELAGREFELVYWHLTGGFVPGEVTALFKGDTAATNAAVATAAEKLAALITRFDDPEQPYLSQPHPGSAPRFNDYTQLARVAEWAALDEGE
jgi:ATP-dependent helicase/nuclease subunit B